MTAQLQPLSQWLRILGFTAIGFWLGLSGISAKSQSVQDFLIHNWDLDEGLPSTCVNAVVRTRDGYVWLGTRHGLARFDGVRFVVFNYDNTPTLQDNRMISLIVDRQGTLWIGTENGNLTRCAQGKFSAVDLGGATHGSSILSMTTDKEDNLWLGTDGAGLTQINKAGAVKTFTSTNGLPSPNIWQVLADSRGRVWYVTSSGILGWIEAGKCHVLAQAGNLPSYIRAIALAHDGGLWLAAQKDWNIGTRILKFKENLITEETQTYIWPQSSWRTRPGVLLEDKAGNLWCGTMGAGVFFRPPDGPWQKLVDDLPFSQAETVCLTEDEGTSIWIGTRTSGLHQAVPRPVNTFHLPAAHNQNVLLTVCVRKDGSIWGGTDGAGVFCWQDSVINRLGIQKGLDGLQINALMEDSHSNFWSGTSAGLFNFQDGQFKQVEKVAGHSPVNALHEDSQGKLWAGTGSGLVCVNDPSQKKYNRNNGLPDGTIQTITHNSTGRLWVVVRGQGVFRQNGENFEYWSPQNTPSEIQRRWGNGGNVYSLLPDGDGSIWAATHGQGLFHLEGNSLREWTWETDGLPSNHEFAIMADGSNNLWLSSENGIFGYSKKSLLNYQLGTLAPTPWRLTQADGLPYKVCSGGSQPVATQSADGRLWFPDGPALVVFDPATLPRHPKIWPPIIEEVRVDGQPMPATAESSIHTKSGARSFEFYFTSPNILLPARLRFRYRMEGLDKDWIPTDTRRSAQYSRLPPGNYTFRVMACDNYGLWNEKTAELRLTVEPRFWETIWFQLSAGLALLGAAGFGTRQFERTRNKRKLATLEREHALAHERSRIARDIHDDLGASLTEVALLGDMAGTNSESPEELRAQTQKISTAAREMTQSLEAIVWAVRPENDSLRSLIEYMNRRTDELFEKMPRQYQFLVPSELPECSIHAEVRHNIFLAYKEALTNSLKYAQASMVRIEMACNLVECKILIADNGKGFDAGTVRTGGTGIKNMRQRMEEIGGRFELESQPGHGTMVRLQFSLPRPGQN